MLPITDTRVNCEKRLYEVEPSDFFIWGDELFRRIETNAEVDLRYGAVDGIPAVHQRSGVLEVIDRNAWVVPCRCELMITE